MRATGLLALSVLTLLAACAAPGGARLGVTPQAAQTRTVELLVRAPGVIAVGAGNVIAVGAGNVVAAGAGNFRVRTATAGYKPVAGASVFLEALSGEALGARATSGPGGLLTLAGVPAGRVTRAVARFEVAGKRYRMAVPLAPGALMGQVIIDPINTMVEARIRQILEKRQDLPAALTGDRLKEVWRICDAAAVQIAPEDLDEGKTVGELVEVYKRLLPQIGNEAERAVVQRFMADLGG